MGSLLFQRVPDVQIGTKKYQTRIEEELQKNPIVFGNFQCKPKTQDLYLGDVISAGGLEASVQATIPIDRED